jgi:peptide/nickel transport system permease protein
MNFLSREPLRLAGLAILIPWLVVALAAPLVAPYGPLAQSTQLLRPPSAGHVFGTDELGRDVLSRTLWGARLSIPLAVVLVASAVFIGGALGSCAGYFGGWVDESIMRFVDLLFAFPTFLLAMAISAALGPGLVNAVVAGIAVTWPQYARVVRGLVRSVSQADYVNATRLLGASALRAMVVDIMPNAAGPIVVLATLGLGNAILLFAGLSFLGLGAKPPVPEWGSMISTGIQYFQYWWVSTAPGMAILSLVLAFNLLGDAYRDTLDRRTT